MACPPTPSTCSPFSSTSSLSPKMAVTVKLVHFYVCFLHGRIRNPACKDPYTSQGLQGQRQDTLHAAGCTATKCPTAHRSFQLENLQHLQSARAKTPLLPHTLILPMLAQHNQLHEAAPGSSAHAVWIRSACANVLQPVLWKLRRLHHALGGGTGRRAPPSVPLRPGRCPGPRCPRCALRAAQLPPQHGPDRDAPSVRR